MSISVVVPTAACQAVRQLHVADVQLALGALPVRLCRASAVVVSFAYGFAIIMGAVNRCRLVLGDRLAYLLTFATFACPFIFLIGITHTPSFAPVTLTSTFCRVLGPP